VYENCDATSKLLPEERDSVSGIARPGAIFCLTDDGGLLEGVERFIRFHNEGAML
jgi:hypothetical protein